RRRPPARRGRAFRRLNLPGRVMRVAPVQVALQVSPVEAAARTDGRRAGADDQPRAPEAEEALFRGTRAAVQDAAHYFGELRVVLQRDEDPAQVIGEGHSGLAGSLLEGG